MSSLLADKLETFVIKAQQLSDCLQKYKDHFGLADEEDKGAKLHQYSSLNIDKEIVLIKECFQLLKSKTEQLNPPTSGIQSVLKSIQDRQQQEDNFSTLQKCMTECIKNIRDSTQDLSLKSVVKKLEAVTMDVGLRFDSAGHSGTDYFISSDMFYVEVQLDTYGGVLDVQVQSHSGDPKQCKELIEILRKRDYKSFKKHLQNLTDLYDLKGDTFVKSKILSSLEAIEADIHRLAANCRVNGDYCDRILHGPVGFVSPRHGVNLMQLTYWAHPFSFLDETKPGGKRTFGSDEILPADFGFSVRIAVESSEMHKLQTVPLLSSIDSGSEQYATFDNNNSEELPATFLMKLTKMLPISVDLVEMIHQITNKFDQDGFVHCSNASLDNLVLKSHLEVQSGKEWQDKEFHQNVGDHSQVCRILPSPPFSNIGLLISRVPFQHPSQVPLLIQILRRQTIFNSLLTSCAGKGKTFTGRQGKKYYYDVVLSGVSRLTVSFQHPLYSSIASVDLRVNEDSSISSELHVAPESPVFCTNDYISKVANRCFSVPLIMRSIVRKASAFVPGNVPAPHPSKSGGIASEKLTLKLPQLQFGDINAVPLVSPGVYSSPAFSGLPASSLSPSGTAFQFSLPDASQSLLHTTHPSSIVSPSKNRGSPIDRKGGKGRTVPKIKLKLKHDGTEYEIDKDKSELDAMSTNPESQLIEGAVSDSDALGLVYSQLAPDVTPDGLHVGETTPISTEDKSSVMQAINFPYGTSNLPFELTVDSLTAGGVTSIGELDNLLVSGIDPTSLVGGGLVSQLTLPGSAFSQGFGDLTGGSETQVEAFDLDAITSGGSQMEFSVDDALSAVSASAIDPSMVVSSSGSLPGAAVFDVDTSLIDIDQFMLNDQGNTESMDTSEKS